MADNDFESYEKIYFTKFSNSLNLDEKTKENSCQYFINYKHNQVITYFNPLFKFSIFYIERYAF